MNKLEKSYNILKKVSESSKKTYYDIARENEEVFRNILRDLNNRDMRFVPKNLKTELDIEELFKKYSEGDRNGKFTILSFSRPEKEKATLYFSNVSTLSGGGAQLEYLVKKDNSVKYKKCDGIFMS